MSKTDFEQLKNEFYANYEDVKYDMYVIFDTQRANGITLGNIYTGMKQELYDEYKDKIGYDYKSHMFALIMYFGKALVDYGRKILRQKDHAFICEYEDVMKRIKEDTEELFNMKLD